MTATQQSINTEPFVHASALCESTNVGQGTRIWAFAHVLEGAVIGRDCNICDHAYIEGGARIGDRVTVKNQAMIWDGVAIEDDVFVGPGVVFTNDLYPRSARMPEVVERYRRRDKWLSPTTVRRGASIGAGAVIVCGLTIGQYATVAAGALVTRDVPDHQLVLGRPARPHGWACVCGTVLDQSLICHQCSRQYEPFDDIIRLTDPI
jgi:UDP-2-acetamido-3-amino-2,3-dideoxy-glucuronate N-acetyltransferase